MYINTVLVDYCFLNWFYEIKENLKSFQTEQEYRIVADKIQASLLIRSQYEKDRALTVNCRRRKYAIVSLGKQFVFFLPVWSVW